MSFTVVPFTNKDGLAFEVTNIPNTATSIVYSVTDTIDTTDSYDANGVSDTSSGSISDSVRIVAGTASKLIDAGTGPTSANGTFKAHEGHIYKYYVYAQTSAGAIVGDTVNGTYTFVDPMEKSDYTVTRGTTSDSVSVAIAYNAATTVNSNNIAVKASHYMVSVAGPDGTAAASQNFWADRLEATNGAISTTTLSTDLITDFSGASEFTTDYIARVTTPAASATAGTYTITDSGGNGTTDAVFQIVVAGGVVTKVYLKSRGAGYSANDTVTLSKTGAFEGDNDVVITLQASDLVSGAIDTGARGMTAGSNYELSVEGSGAYGSIGGGYTYRVTPSSSANAVTMNTPVTGVALTAAPYNLGATDTDNTIGIYFTAGTQAANADFKDVAYIMKLTSGGTDYYRKVSNVVSLAHMSGTLAANTTDAAINNGSDLYYIINSSTKWVTATTGNDADSAGSAVALPDGTEVTVDVLAVNKDQNGVHNSGTASGDPRTATPSGLPDKPAVAEALTGSQLGAADSDMSGKVKIRVKLTNASGNATADNGSAITKVGFKLTGATGGVTDNTGNAAIEVSTTDTSKFYGTSAFGYYDYTVGSLNNGEVYTLSELSFFNANGESTDYDDTTITATPSTLASFGVASGTGVPPDGVMSTIGISRIQVTWSAPANNGGSAITGYTIQYSVNSDLSNPSTVTAAANATSHTIPGLTNGTKYYVQVFATNSNGSSAALPIVKTDGDVNDATDRALVPSGYPNMTQVPNILTTAALTTGDTFNSISFTIDPTNAIGNTAGYAYNMGYAPTAIRAYLVVAGAQAGASASTSTYIDVAYADRANAQTITPSADMITAASNVSGSNQGKYYFKTYIVNAVYGTSEGDVLAGTGQVAQKSGADMYVSFYNTALSFTTQPNMELDNTVDGNGDFNGTKMTISWEVSEFGTSSTLNTVPLSTFDVVVSECAPKADGNGLIAFPQSGNADDYTALNVSSLTGLSGSGTTGVISVSSTTRTYTLVLATSDAAPVYYGFKYKVEVTAKSSANGTIKSLAASALSDITPANKPTISVAVDSQNNQVDLTVLPNGSAMDDSFLLTPGASGTGTEVQDFSASLAVGNGVYAGGNPPFNSYIPNGGSRTNLTALSREASNLAANTSAHLVISENGMGASIVLTGNPLSSLANPA